MCNLKFASWAFDGSKLDIEIDESETGAKGDIYQNNTEWEMVNVSVKRKEVSKEYWPWRSRLLCERQILLKGHYHRDPLSLGQNCCNI